MSVIMETLDRLEEFLAQSEDLQTAFSKIYLKALRFKLNYGTDWYYQAHCSSPCTCAADYIDGNDHYFNAVSEEDIHATTIRQRLLEKTEEVNETGSIKFTQNIPFTSKNFQSTQIKDSLEHVLCVEIPQLAQLKRDLLGQMEKIESIF